MIQPKLKQWVQEQTKRHGWTVRQVADRAGLPHSSISRTTSPDEWIGLKVCEGLAKAFNTPLGLLIKVIET